MHAHLHVASDIHIARTVRIHAYRRLSFAQERALNGSDSVFRYNFGLIFQQRARAAPILSLLHRVRAHVVVHAIALRGLCADACHGSQERCTLGGCCLYAWFMRANGRGCSSWHNVMMHACDAKMISKSTLQDQPLSFSLILFVCTQTNPAQHAAHKAAMLARQVTWQPSSCKLCPLRMSARHSSRCGRTRRMLCCPVTQHALRQFISACVVMARVRKSMRVIVLSNRIVSAHAGWRRDAHARMGCVSMRLSARCAAPRLHAVRQLFKRLHVCGMAHEGESMWTTK